MTIFSNFKKYAIVAALVLGVAACSDDDDGNGGNPDISGTIVETAIGDEDLSSLVAALEKADLVGILNGPGPFTVLAPTNQAFANLLDNLNVASLDDLTAEQLRPVLLNHVIAGKILTAETLTTAGNGYDTTAATYDDGDSDTMNNPALSIYFTTEGGVTFNGISTVMTADIRATNGIIHKVDEVITLPTVATFAVANENLSTLVAALTTLTPSTDFPSILSRTADESDGINPPFTVFAPTNDAFAAISVPTDEAQVAAILQAHVISGANVRSSMLADVEGDVGTLNGDVTIVANPPTVQGSDNEDPVEINTDFVDIQAINGVIHVVNGVILPEL
ncbi:fasciclin domain-containing protein [Aquimarina sp. ERC-38]|uniref:fasciclin domain-containing protein n=1 Tax=Aquimarina sp. ERC-38 TaxID=2949996 RepID=UPI002247C4CC|nr:fasciclin domain-containing protein [Aquimarina sp. ERC-38]UZO80476.1 fasciclin domain-containing protein [Aquimarina sp. ERC-38]